MPTKAHVTKKAFTSVCCAAYDDRRAIITQCSGHRYRPSPRTVKVDCEISYDLGQAPADLGVQDNATERNWPVSYLQLTGVHCSSFEAAEENLTRFGELTSFSLGTS